MKYTAMKTILKFLKLGVFLAAILLLAGCGSTSSWPKSIPNGKILFQSDVQTKVELNFIQIDGSNHHRIDLSQNFVKPSWSSDGEILYGLSSPSNQNYYEDAGYPAYWNIKSGLFKRCDNNLPYYRQIIEANDNPDYPHEVLLNNPGEVTLFDLDTCKEVKKIVDYNERSGEFGIVGASNLSEKQELLFGEYTEPDQSRDYRLMQLNLKTGEQVQLARGINPAWSPDGSQIAYIGLDGLYVMDAGGKQSRQLVKTQFFDPWRSGSPRAIALCRKDFAEIIFIPATL
jgi:hypothetical protein